MSNVVYRGRGVFLLLCRGGDGGGGGHGEDGDVVGEDDVCDGDANGDVDADEGGGDARTCPWRYCLAL